MKLKIFAAAIAAGVVAHAPARALDLNTPEGLITVAPGESLTIAMDHAAQLRRAAQLKAAWQASHAGSTAASVAYAQPQIFSGNVVSGTLQVGTPSSVPVVQFNYTTSKVGLSSAEFLFVSPNGQNGIELVYYQGAYVTRGSIVFSSQINAPYFAQPGKWVMSSAFITDNSGTYSQYDAAQLAALIQNPFLTVVNNGQVDITPPVVTAGKVLTPTVSLSSPLPQFRVRLSASDSGSGVALGYVLIQPPGADFDFTQLSFAPFALKSGEILLSAGVPSYEPAGTWGIGGYEVCDVAQNCFTTVSSADVQALFGTTTFTVTQ